MEKISSHQFMTLGAAVLMGTTFLPAASIVTGAGGRDGWIGVLPGFVIGVPYGLMILYLLTRHPQKNLIQITESLLGKWVGKIAGVIYILITAYFGGLLLGQCGDIFERSIMPLTPIALFYLGGLLIVLYLVWAGIEVFARFSEVVFPLIVMGLILNVGLSFQRIEQGELLPILSKGLKPVMFSVLKTMPFAMEYILFIAGLLNFLPSGKQEKGALKTGVWRAVFLVGTVNMFVVIIQILVFGPVETVRLVYGLLVLGKMIEISRTISGIESLFMMIWFGAVVIKVTAFFYTTIWGLETVFNVKGKLCNLAVGLAFLGIAFGFVKGHSLIMEITLVDDYLILPFASVWVLCLWLVSHWRKEIGVS
jgi:spore germination protein (amino acid permease)